MDDCIDYEWQPLPRAVAGIESYMFLRTRLPIEKSHDLFSALGDSLPPDTRALKIGRSVFRWENGLVLSMETRENATEIGRKLKSSLRDFDAWGIIDDQGNCAEGPMDSPLSMYFRGTGLRKMACLFLRFRHRDEPDEITDLIKSRLADPASARSAFYFRDGRVLFAKTTEPVQTIKSRMERDMDRLYRFAACGANGEPWSAQGECRWSYYL